MEKEIQTGGNEAAAPHDRRHLYITWGAILVAIASIAASFMIVRGAGANADYICTHVVEENGNCTNGSWGTWTTVSSSNDTAACAMNKIEKRTYTGTRTTRHILQYLNLRTACDGGYAQAGNGNQNGASGFHGGTIVTESAACQIEETRTTRNQGNNCATPVTETISATTDIAALNSQSNAVSGIDQLTAFRVSMIAANIYAKPSLVRSGGTSVIKWQSRETTSCTVVGTNGDSWEGTAGEKTSGIIANETTYTLTCIAFNGQTVTDQATVTIIPVFQEL
ncbi:MAG: hypothetical protein A2854_03555 [Parcubacteria group bacterium RIFCSPHIGHO2_01_FULL_56_18]|nr:MAG: hypothetical protein A2854_03555 [Parcubacteria group bacterium RIFCSPHIGHO2_01_FULL_56_18]